MTTFPAPFVYMGGTNTWGSYRGINPDTGQPRYHWGDDYSAPLGTPIPADQGGVVVYSGNNQSGGLGNAVIVKNTDGNYSVYAHNQENSVTEGRTINPGDIVGTVGATGRVEINNPANGVLHYAIIQAGQTVNPYNGTNGSIGLFINGQTSLNPSTYQGPQTPFTKPGGDSNGPLPGDVNDPFSPAGIANPGGAADTGGNSNRITQGFDNLNSGSPWSPTINTPIDPSTGLPGNASDPFSPAGMANGFNDFNQNNGGLPGNVGDPFSPAGMANPAGAPFGNSFASTQDRINQEFDQFNQGGATTGVPSWLQQINPDLSNPSGSFFGNGQNNGSLDTGSSTQFAQPGDTGLGGDSSTGFNFDTGVSTTNFAGDLSGGTSLAPGFADPTPIANQTDFAGGFTDQTDFGSLTDQNNFAANDNFGFGGSSGFGFAPIVLDLAGNGINITQLSQSNTFFDSTGSGQQNLTAWAGTGNGVLFFDPTGTGQLTQANQVIFTDWDPSATSDMQALLDVFDTNHDGALDAGDTNFANFFVMVTNADGTQTARSLASLGITSINLNQDATNIALPDGSSINGETTYTTSGGTGTAATVTFATDANGYVVTGTTTTNADGSVTIADTADNSDGSVAYQRILNTLTSSAVSSGITTTTTDKTLTSVNNGGVVMTLQTDHIVASTNGVTSETLTHYRGGAITSAGELTSAGTSGSEKLNATATTTTVSSGGTVVTILRDQLGGGWTTQQEVDTTSAGGSASYVISNLNPDGTASNVTSTTVTNGGLTRTTTNLIDGNAAMATNTVDATVVSGSTRTRTVTTSAGTTVTSLVTTVTQTTANTVTRTTTSDLTDGTTLDLTTVAQTVTSSGGAATTTQTDASPNGTLLDKTVTTNTPQSSGGLVTSVTTSALDNGAFIVVGSQTTTISNAGGSKTTTVVNDSANGTLLSESIVSGTLGSAARTVTIYANGDGKVSQSETVTVSSGTTTDTLQNLNGDGSLVNEAVTTTTSGGLARTIQVDSTGAGTPTAPVFDHTTSDTTTTSAGISTETVTHYGASTSNKIDQTQTVVSANGLTTTVSRDFTGAGFVADGTWDQVTTDQTVVNGDGSLNETITVADGGGHTLEAIQKSTSTDRRTITTTTTLGTTNLVKQVETVTTSSNGTVTDQLVHFDQLGDVLGATVATTSADGLVKTIRNDIQGQSAAIYTSSGLAFDRTLTDTTVINADGSHNETVNTTAQNGTLLSTTSVLTSPNRLSVTTTANPFATAHYATRTTDVTTLNADGSRTETVSDYNFNQARIDQTQMVTSAGGLSSTVLHDFDGDGVTDQSTTDVTTINADGTRTEVVTHYTGGTNGSVRDITTIQSGIIVVGAGLKTVITRQSNGSVPTYQTETIAPSANGTVTDTTQHYATSGGPLLLMTTATTSANGLTRTMATAVKGDTTTDFSTTDSITLNADGSQTETVASSNRAGLIRETVTKTFANGLSTIRQVDANGAVNGSGAPIFNRVTTDNTVLNGDGSRTETVTATSANGATIGQTVTNTSADQQTITTSRYLNATGTITTVDQSETLQTQTNGSVVDTVTSYNAAHALLGTVTRTTSGNGLSVQTVYQNAAGTTVDTQSETTTYDTNGDGGNLLDCEDTDVINSTTTLRSSVKTQTSGNGQTKAITMALSGALAGTIAPSFNAAANESISIADTGATTQTVTNTINGSPIPNDTTIIVTSADKLTTTTSTTLGSSALPYIVAVKSIGLDGSVSDQTTYYDPADLFFIVQQANINVSYDGRTTTETDYSDYDGTQYNVVTDTFVRNADDTTTETRSGTGSFGATAFSQTVNVVINADASTTTTTLNYDGTGALIGQIVADVSPNGLTKSFVFDTTGQETTANLNAAAADILSGAALPASLLGTDIIGSDATTLNTDGSKTEVIKTAYGNSFANLRSQTTTTTSANGLVTVTRIDNNGNGVFNQVETTTIAPDGSKSSVSNYYGDTTDTLNTLVGSNTYTVSANGLITTLATSTGITDITATFPHANGSYEWSRTVAANSPAAYYGTGYQPGSASHFIDANGIDTWTVNNGYGDPTRTITIDLATERQDLATANEIYQTVLGHTMDDAERQFVAYDITNGILDRNTLAHSLITSTQEYNVNYGIFTGQGANAGYIYYGFDVLAAFENALGRLPTAEEMATFGQYMEKSAAPTALDLATMAVAVAQYAADQGEGPNRSTADPNQDLVSTAPQWISPAANALQILASGTYSYSDQWLADGDPATGSGAVAFTVNGNNDVIVAYGGSVVTVSGFNDSVDLPSQSATVNASNTAIMVEDGGIGIVSGNNDQIAQVGPSEVILTAGAGDQIYVGAGTLLSGFAYTSAFPTTSASNASITIGPDVGTLANAAEIFGNNDKVNVGANSWAMVNGTGNAVNVTGTGIAAINGTANGSVVSNGGTLEVLSGSIASNTTVLSGGMLDVFGGGSLAGTTTISAGGTLVVDSGFTQNNYTVGSGVFLEVASGGIVNGTTVASGGTLFLLGGAIANGTINMPGSFLQIGYGYSISGYVTSSNVTLQVGTSGTVSGATVTSGTELDVFNGGTVSNATVNSGGNLLIYGTVNGATVASGGHASVLQGGFLGVQAGQSVWGVSVSNGGMLLVSPGGTATNTTVFSGGALDLLGGAITSGTTIQTGGILIADSGFTETNYVVSSGLMLEVGSAGTASNTTVLSGGTLDLWGGAITTGTMTISAGGTLIVDSGYIQNNYTVSSGVILEVASGGTANNVTVSSGAELIVDGTVNGATALSGAVFVSSGGTINVLSGQTVSGVSVENSGNLLVSSGGVASNTTVDDGGRLTVFGTASGATVAVGGTATVSSGGTLDVLSGQVDWNVPVASAGTLVVSSGGTVSNTTVGSGGLLTVNGTVVGATVSNGGAVISSGGVLDTNGQSVAGVAVNSGGTLIVDYGATASNLTISSGGKLTVYGSYVGGATIASGATTLVSGGSGQLDVLSGQTVQGVGVVDNAFLVVSSGGLASGTTVSSGGILYLLGGAVASGTTVSSGGILEIASGFTQNNYVVGRGTTLEVGSAGIVNGTTVSSGGTLELLSGGTANGTTYAAGSFMEITGGYMMSNYVTSANVTLEVASGGIVSGATVVSATTLDVLYGGVVSGVTVNSGGNLVIDGTVSGATVAAGGNVTVAAWGTLDVTSGQTVQGVSVSSGGTLNLIGGTAVGATIGSGGWEFVFSGGVDSGTTLNGGTEIVSAGGVANGITAFGANGGSLLLEQSTGFAGRIGGFTTSADHLDLADIAFGSSTTVSFVEAGGNTSGTLTVSDGVHSAALTLLGNHVTSNFIAASDGNGGTLITDPPIEQAPVNSVETANVPAGGTATIESPPPAIQQAIVDSGETATAPAAGGVPSGATGNAFGGQVQTPSGAAVGGGTPSNVSGTDIVAATNATVSSGGLPDASGTASDTTVGNGGQMVASGSGTAVDTSDVVCSGRATDRAVTDGKSLKDDNGCSINSATTASSDSSVDRSGTVSGSHIPDLVDAISMAFGSNDTLGFSVLADNLGGSGHPADFALLNQFAAAQFASASDGHGSTVISDLAVAAEMLAVNAHAQHA